MNFNNYCTDMNTITFQINSQFFISCNCTNAKGVSKSYAVKFISNYDSRDISFETLHISLYCHVVSSIFQSTYIIGCTCVTQCHKLIQMFNLQYIHSNIKNLCFMQTEGIDMNPKICRINSNYISIITLN